MDKRELNKIIHPNKWLDFHKLSAYYIEHGRMNSCLDVEFESIENAVIDGASEAINNDYDKMIELRFQQEEEDE